MRIFVLAESAVTNSLGRGISLALVGREWGSVELWARDDGPTWTGARHFDVEVHRFSSTDITALVQRIRLAARDEPALPEPLDVKDDCEEDFRLATR